MIKSFSEHDNSSHTKNGFLFFFPFLTGGQIVLDQVIIKRHEIQFCQKFLCQIFFHLSLSLFLGLDTNLTNLEAIMSKLKPWRRKKRTTSTSLMTRSSECVSRRRRRRRKQSGVELYILYRNNENKNDADATWRRDVHERGDERDFAVLTQRSRWTDVENFSNHTGSHQILITLHNSIKVWLELNFVSFNIEAYYLPFHWYVNFCMRQSA